MPRLEPGELTALGDAVTRLLADRSSEAQVRETMETSSGFDATLWQQLADMGVAGLLAEERFGGTAAGAAALERVAEIAGAQLLCSPLLATVLAIAALTASNDDTAQARLLPDIVAGRRIATLASTGPDARWTDDAVAVVATPNGANWQLDGASHYVPHGQNAHTLLVVARSRSPEWADSLGLFEVDARATGLECTALPTFDHTLRLANLQLTGTPARAIGALDRGWSAAAAAHRLGLIALAGDQAGGARRTLEFTVEYAKTRIQFGRAIGSFQAIKHMAADLLLEVESATSAARAAAAALDNAHRSAAAAEEAETALALAAFACAEAYSTVTATAVQMHGGIAFTWDHPAHLYLRRARADAQLFGAPAYHRERFVQLLGG